MTLCTYKVCCPNLQEPIITADGFGQNCILDDFLLDSFGLLLTRAMEEATKRSCLKLDRSGRRLRGDIFHSFGRVLLAISHCTSIAFAPSMLRDFHTHLHCSFLLRCKEVIDLLQGKIRRLRVAEVDKRDEGEVESHEDEVAFPSEAGDERGRNHDDEEIP